jgi:hypothetical protein
MAIFERMLTSKQATKSTSTTAVPLSPTAPNSTHPTTAANLCRSTLARAR